MLYKSSSKEVIIHYLLILCFSMAAYFWEGKNNFSVIISFLLVSSVIYESFMEKVVEICLENTKIKITIRKKFKHKILEISYTDLFFEYFKGAPKLTERISFFENNTFVCKLRSTDGWNNEDIKEIVHLLFSRADGKELK